MFTKIQEKWLVDLETTEELQRTGCLFNGEGFCCLGRGAIVCGKKKKDIRDVRDLNLEQMERVVEKLQLKNVSGSFFGLIGFKGGSFPQKFGFSLVGLNDSVRLSFKEIAKFIRENPEAVFKNFRKDNETKTRN